MSGTFGLELQEAMEHMKNCMDIHHPMLAEELPHLLIDRNLSPEDDDVSLEAMMQHLLTSKCFQSECTWVRALVLFVMIRVSSCHVAKQHSDCNQGLRHGDKTLRRQLICPHPTPPNPRSVLICISAQALAFWYRTQRPAQQFGCSS